ncbi:MULTISPECIES: outer membrane beta-barrel protein [Olivibacter]|jgi:opacity protein-like surface antigen|uniref:Outer membrane protein beta-barrel domain-containing protein n=2 Tax=Sphingobacteriaceae TaxID=84566 RepID=F4CDU6_SPHS2|nr:MULTISPECIES: outer membrane beta-barrel protein [Olivibacter]MDM8176200.1 outer membrane beta-barrel protein [Olivibacter sp. 47]QEL00962.1 porin family protein [Olivibacter sp. LS-1]
MKKMILMASILAGSFFYSAKAQDDYNKGFYIKAGGAYFLKVTPVEFPAIGGQPARDRVFNIIPGNPPTQQTVSESTITGSFGEGWRVGLTPGYRFSRILGVEVGLNYYNSRSQDMMRQRGSLGGNEVLNLHNSGKVKAFDVAPALVAHIPTNSSVKPYMKAGVIIPIGGHLEITTTANDQTGSVAESMHMTSGLPPNAIMTLHNVKRVDRIKANPTVGFQSAVGFDWMLNDRISIYAELEYRNISVGGKKKELHELSGEYNVVMSGQPLTSGTLSKDAASESSKLVNYHKTITAGDNVAGWEGFDSNKPADELRSYINIGGLGVNLGIKIPFGN